MTPNRPSSNFAHNTRYPDRGFFFVVFLRSPSICN